MKRPRQLFRTMFAICALFCFCIGFYLKSFSQNIQEHTFDNWPDSLVYIDSSDFDNIWIVGDPDKPYFSNGYFSNMAIYTDTMYYPNSDKSSFYVNYTNHNIYYSIILTFYYKVDADSLNDFGGISVNDGSQWHDLIKDFKTIGSYTVYNSSSELLYYSQASDSIAFNPFTGLSDGWYCFRYHLGINYDWWPSTVQFRFEFSSDSTSDNREGWLIDYITISDIYDYGIETSSAEKFKLYPNPVNSILNIHAENSANESYFISIYAITGELLRKFEFNNDKTIIDFHDLACGTYIYNIFNTNTILKRGIIIKN